MIIAYIACIVNLLSKNIFSSDLFIFLLLICVGLITLFSFDIEYNLKVSSTNHTLGETHIYSNALNSVYFLGGL